MSEWFEEFLFGAGGRENAPAVVTFVGSGGKTSLIWLLARFLARRVILVTPSTKIFVPAPEEKCFDRYCEGIPAAPVPGITLAGCFNAETGKLESLPTAALEKAVRGYDAVLIEGDGAKELPLKGWAEHEPVVPSVTNVTVGVLPLWPLGMPVSEKIIHRLPLFCELTGASPGDTITAGHFAAVIEGGGKSRSLFTDARGRRILFFNQAENARAVEQCRETLRLLTPEFRVSLSGIIAGSVKQNTVHEMNVV